MLTDTKCCNAKPTEKPYKLTDSNGLLLEVKPNGVKAWRYRFELREAGKVKESLFALGEYATAPNGETPEEAKARRAGGRLTLAESREERTKARALVKQGINPAHHRQIERKKRELDMATTFEAVANEWLGLKDWEEITKKRRLDMLTRVVFPTIGPLPVKQITPPVILDILKKAADKNGPSVMAEAKRTMFGIFELAAETFRVDSNPVHQWREALPKNKTQHKRPLETSEIGQLLRDVDDHGGRHEHCFPHLCDFCHSCIFGHWCPPSGADSCAGYAPCFRAPLPASMPARWRFLAPLNPHLFARQYSALARFIFSAKR